MLKTGLAILYGRSRRFRRGGPAIRNVFFRPTTITAFFPDRDCDLSG